ncbi:hypothetical protein MicB006_4567 [Micromonospora sp. B006]|nr:hypothetical protein MicB006_4567 [Micromonospora sp. B006]
MRRPAARSPPGASPTGAPGHEQAQHEDRHRARQQSGSRPEQRGRRTAEHGAQRHRQHQESPVRRQYARQVGGAGPTLEQRRRGRLVGGPDQPGERERGQ